MQASTKRKEKRVYEDVDKEHFKPPGIPPEFEDKNEFLYYVAAKDSIKEEIDEQARVAKPRQLKAKMLTWSFKSEDEEGPFVEPFCFAINLLAQKTTVSTHALIDSSADPHERPGMHFYWFCSCRINVHGKHYLQSKYPG